MAPRLFFVFLGVFFLGFLTKSICRASTPSRKPFKCRLEVAKVLEATIGRGPPYMVQILQNDPQHADNITSESHGDHHLSCTYQIIMNSKTYRYREEFPNTLMKLQEADCGTPETKKKVNERIRQFTQECKSPLANPSMGYPLVPEL